MAGSKRTLPKHWTEGGLWQMTEQAKAVTFIGAGGKTTCVRALAREIDAAGCSVIATTTTKVWPETGMISWKSPDPPVNQPRGVCFWYVEVMADSGKWVGPCRKTVDDAITAERGLGEPGCRRFWIIEGDGAKSLKLKCWEAHEPQIPGQTACAVLVLDGGLWGKVLHRSQVHRPQCCPDILDQMWNAESAWRYFLRSPVFYSEYVQLPWVILLNAPGLRDVDGILTDLRRQWMKILREVSFLDLEQKVRQDESKTSNCRPRHLRLAAGDAKGGRLQWLDLW